MRYPDALKGPYINSTFSLLEELNRHPTPISSNLYLITLLLSDTKTYALIALSPSPLLSQFKDYSSRSLAIDLKAGLTVGVLLIPQAMAYALLAGMPPIYGLYAGLIPLLLYAFLGTSRQLSIGPVAISSILILTGVAEISNPGGVEYISYVILAGLLIGMVQFAMGLCRLGFLANFLSQPVISGFTSAAAMIILASQLKDILGIATPSHVRGIENFIYALDHIRETHISTFLIFFVAILILVIIKRIIRSFPIALFAIIVSTLLSYWLNWNEIGVAIVGDVPIGLPGFQIPAFSIDKLMVLIPTVATVSLIGVVECISIAKTLESKTNEHVVDTNRELIAIGVSKIGGSFFQALPSSASFSRSAINNNSGAISQVSSIVTALLILLALLFLTPLFYFMPIAILSAIIVQAVLGLIDIPEIKNLWKTDRKDFIMLMVTLLATLILGIDMGVITGLILSLFIVLYQSSIPQISILGQVSGTTHYRNLDRFEDVKLVEGLFKDEIRKLVSAQKKSLHHIILDATAIYNIDSSGIKALRTMDQELDVQNIDLHLSGARGELRDRLAINGLLSEPDKHHLSIHSAVQYVQNKIMSDHSHRAVQTNL
jgi:SulP family sulfate permease